MSVWPPQWSARTEKTLPCPAAAQKLEKTLRLGDIDHDISIAKLVLPQLDDQRRSGVLLKNPEANMVSQLYSLKNDYTAKCKHGST